MKFQAILAFVALASAKSIKQKDSPDCPESTQVFSYNERKPAAAGFSQVRFASGMNGDEDLGEDITMKGDHFHYNQLPTCSETVTTACQPVCTESLTTGCTEARTPVPPQRERFEGARTFH
uniref:Uncharacterized protein n=1 Tax=Strombidium inclinatum TaxID=197538 RepID=A0A7S3MY78_9SPIT|mmetsp:Transcript_27955/g.42259  ORF Transcript_27955/g.42259 Transcript_27955/m.42259 type:complete len:121 (+) Transcript_27955:2-364(+)